MGLKRVKAPSGSTRTARACYEVFAGEVAITSLMTRKPYPSDVSDDEWTELCSKVVDEGLR